MRWINAVRQWAQQMPLFWVACVAISGIALADGQLLGLICPILLIAGCVWWIRRPWIAAAILLVLVGYSLWHLKTILQIHAFPLATDRVTSVKGKGWIHSDTGQKNPMQYRGVLALDELFVGDEQVALSGAHYFVVSIEPVDGRAITYGDEISFSGLLKPIDSAATPGAFDPAKYYFRSANAIAQLAISPGDSYTVNSTNPRGFWLRRQAIAARKWMETGLSHGVARTDQTLNQTILAMVLGSREKSPEQIEEWFRLSGTLHIFAVSGLHVGVIAILLWWMLRWTGLPRVSAVYIVIPAILFYAILTGLRPSSCRAALMLAIFLLGFSLRLRPSPLNALGAAALILISIDTQQVFLPGFQLSFCVVFALILSASLLSKWLHEPFRIDDFIPRKRIGFWRICLDNVTRFISSAAALSVASWVGSLFLMDSHFSGITPIGLLANIVMVPIAGVIVTIAGISIACFGVKLTFATVILNQVNLALITILTGLAQFFASIPGGHIHTGEEDVKQAELSLNVMGVGGEMTTLMRNRDDYWLIDSGGHRTFSTQMLPLIRTRGINQIEGLVLSHGDAGHIGKVPYILQHLPPKLVIESALPNKARVYKEIDQLLVNKAIQRLQVQAPQRITIDEHLHWEVLHPSPQDPPTGIADDRCLVLMLKSHHWRLLYTFDTGFLVEKALLDQNKNIKADIWIRGQHSQTGASPSSSEFLAEIDPKVIITTAAEFPPHERLDSRWVKSLQQQSIQLLSLNEIGSVQLDFYDRQLQIQPFLKKPVIELRK